MELLTILEEAFLKTRKRLETKHIGRIGAVSLDLCYVASGAYDAYLDVRGTLRPENFFAAKLMITGQAALTSSALSSNRFLETQNLS